MIEVKKYYVVAVAIILFIMFIYGLSKVRKAIKNLSTDFESTTAGLFGDIIVFILLPIFILILYLIGQFDNYIII